MDWDAGKAQNVWQDLIGYSAAFLGSSYTETSVEAGVQYSLRVRAQNLHGWSDWSTPYTTILAASVPEKMAMVTVTDGEFSATAIRVSW